jgi:hypothetical protein
MKVIPLEHKVREALESHMAAGGVVSSPDRLVASVIKGFDQWLENRQSLYKKDDPESAQSIAMLRERNIAGEPRH